MLVILFVSESDECNEVINMLISSDPLLTFLTTFSTRGLILDADKGDFVKVSKDGKVIRYICS